MRVFLRTRGLRDSDAGVALPVALGVILFLTATSILLLGMIISMATPVQRSQAGTKALGAAQGGIDAAMAAIRSSGVWEASDTNPLDGTLVGDYTKLPCGPLRGSVAGADSDYVTTLTYVRMQGTTEVAITACPVNSRPARVYLSSAGSVAAGGTTVTRTVESSYTFKSGDTATGVPGGRIHNYTEVSEPVRDLCLDAGATPGVGTVVKMQECEGDVSDRSTIPDRQKWSYRVDYSIVLAPSEGDAPFSGLCLDASAVNQNVTLRTCDGTGSQKWNFNDAAAFQGELEDLSGMAQYCLFADNSPGSNLTTRNSNCRGPYNINSTWDPEPTVGAGNAGTQFNQQVNYDEFGRCFDVTDWDLNKQFMIAFPCKQDASIGGQPGWNQRLEYTPTSPVGAALSYGTLRVSGQSRCVTAPASVTDPDTAYIRVDQDCNVNNVRQRWVVYGRFSPTGRGEDPLVSYTIRLYQDGATASSPPTMCMSLGPPGRTSPTDPLSQWSTIVLNTCATSTAATDFLEQKWNAPPGFLDQLMGDNREVPLQ